jgi:hypothetical protein
LYLILEPGRKRKTQTRRRSGGWGIGSGHSFQGAGRREIHAVGVEVTRVEGAYTAFWCGLRGGTDYAQNEPYRL